MFERIVRFAARRPGRVLLVLAVLAGLAAAAALRLEPSAATETLAGRSSDTWGATERYRERFGDHSVVVLVRGPLPQVLLTGNLGRLLGLEGCLSGNKPADAPAPGGPGSACARFAATKPVQVVYGPGTFVNSAAEEIQAQLVARQQASQAQADDAARAARKAARARGRSPADQDRLAAGARELVEAGFTREVLQLALRYGLSAQTLPRIDDPDFVSKLVFDAKRSATTPKARFAYLFPNADTAIVQVRLKPGLSEAQRRDAIALIREAAAMKEWRLEGASYTVTGAPVLVDGLADALAGSTLRLLVIALLVMAVTLLLAFRSRLRLAPLVIALGATAVTFGLASLLSWPLTIASIAVLPVVLGLGVDYAIQYQARVEEEEADADTARAAGRAARLAVPTIAVAAAATVAGFLVLQLSPVPMVRGFGLLLVVGIVVAFFFALSAGTAALVASARAAGEGPVARSLRGAGELLGGAGEATRRAARRAGRGIPSRVAAAALRGAIRHPARVLGAGLVLAVAGWAVDSQTRVESDVTKLVPQTLPELRDVDRLQRATGVAGEIDVVVEGDDLTDPRAVAWMSAYQSRLLERYGYSDARGCGRASLCPALSLPDLFTSPQAAASRSRIRELLDAVPPYFSQAVITADRRTANLAFGIKLMPLDRQQEVVEAMRAGLDPPRGITARVGGLPALAAEANAGLSSPARRLGMLAASLAAVALTLLIAYRSRRRALIPLVPIVLATGWSALVLFALRVPLNPMSATLGALVVAITTEFSVLLSARFRQERAAGHAPPEALRRTYRSTGAAVVASGATAIAGFAVLAFSDVQMLEDFGRVTVVDLSVSLLGVLIALPAVLVIAERRAGMRVAASGSAAGAGAPPGTGARVAEPAAP